VTEAVVCTLFAAHLSRCTVCIDTACCDGYRSRIATPTATTDTAAATDTTATGETLATAQLSLLLPATSATTVDVRAWEAAGRPEPLGLLLTDSIGVTLGGSIIERFMRIDYPGYQLAREAFVAHMQSQTAHPYHVWGALGMTSLC
jgi:hypothetical protein